MKIEYHNLYTHFVFTTLHRLPVIVETVRERIEKYITGIVNNHDSKMYAIYANPEHIHFLVIAVTDDFGGGARDHCTREQRKLYTQKRPSSRKISMARYLFSILRVKI